MRIVEIAENRVTLQLEAADCLMVARVLDRGLAAILGNQRPDEYMLTTMAGALLAAFESAGMAASAYMKQTNGDLEGWSLATLRGEHRGPQLTGTGDEEGGNR